MAVGTSRSWPRLRSFASAKSVETTTGAVPASPLSDPATISRLLARLMPSSVAPVSDTGSPSMMAAPRKNS